MRPAQPPQPPGPGIRRTGFRRHVGMPPCGRTEIGTVKRTALDPGASGPMWASAPTVGRTGGAWWGSNLVPGGYIIRPYRQACKFTVGRFFDSLRRHMGGTPLRHAARATSPQGEALASAIGKPPCTRGLANAPCAPLRAKRTYSLFPLPYYVLCPVPGSSRSRRR